MNLIPGKVFVPISVLVTALAGFGAASFKVGGFYNQATLDSASVKSLQADVAKIKQNQAVAAHAVAILDAKAIKIQSDVTRLLSKVKLLTPQQVSWTHVQGIQPDRPDP